MSRLFATFVLLVMLANSAAGQVKMTTSSDNYAKTVTAATARFQIEDPSQGFVDPWFAFAWLTGVENIATDTEKLHMTVYYSGGSWAFFTAATDSAGLDLPVVQINQQANGITGVTEEVRVLLTRPYLEAHRTIGLDIKLYGKHRQTIVKLPATYVDSLLRYLQPTRELMRGTADVRTAPAVASRVKLGVNYIPITAAMAAAMGQAVPAGVVVAAVSPDSVGASAGLQAGDVLLLLAKQPIAADINGLKLLLSAVDPGQAVAVRVWRAGKEIDMLLQF